MRKNVFGRRLKRDTNERKALFKGLVSSLVLQGRIKTTQAKAKAIKSSVDKLITKAKRGQEQGRRLVAPYISSDALETLIKDIAPRFANRNGGYTRIIKLGERLKDNASMVLMEWTEGEKVESGKLKVEKEGKKTSKKKTTKKKEEKK